MRKIRGGMASTLVIGLLLACDADGGAGTEGDSEGETETDSGSGEDGAGDDDDDAPGDDDDDDDDPPPGDDDDDDPPPGDDDDDDPPPGDDDDDDDDDDNDDDMPGTGGEEPPPMGATVSGEVSRILTALIMPGNDGIGPLYLTLGEDCDAMAEPAHVVVVEGADLSMQSSTVEFVFEGVEDGVWQIGAFLDDNESADPAAPAPDMGDLIMSNLPLTTSCVEIEVAGENLEGVEVVLNFTSRL